MNSLQKGQNEHGRVSVRKPYMTPQVQIYGDLRQITQAIGSTGMADHCQPNCVKLHDTTGP